MREDLEDPLRICTINKKNHTLCKLGETMLRTHTCGELTSKATGNKVALCGWIDTRRDHGNLIFLDLRDRWGKTQLVFNSEDNRQLHQRAEKLRPEFVIQVKGDVAKRPVGTINPKLATGEIEVRVQELNVLNTSETPPFEILDATNVSEEIRSAVLEICNNLLPTVEDFGKEAPKALNANQIDGAADIETTTLENSASVETEESHSAPDPVGTDTDSQASGRPSGGKAKSSAKKRIAA